jgi:hypothetical protein
MMKCNSRMAGWRNKKRPLSSLLSSIRPPAASRPKAGLLLAQNTRGLGLGYCSHLGSTVDACGDGSAGVVAGSEGVSAGVADSADGQGSAHHLERS